MSPLEANTAENFVVHEEIFRKKFACDYSVCMGACCTMPGGSGPPVTPDEIEIIQSAWSLVSEMVPSEHRSVVEKHGLFEHEGSRIHIRCCNNRACVFVCYRGNIAICAIQEAYSNGLIEWPKPLSCHLYPIRVKRNSNAVLVFDELDACASAVKQGEAEGIWLLDFLEEPLIRAFGRRWFTSVQELAKRYRAGKEGCGCRR
jgi:hypothetical protein